MGNRQDEQFRLDCHEIVHETDNAILVRVFDMSKHWIPLSQVHSIHRDEPPYLYVTPWIAKQKGFY